MPCLISTLESCCFYRPMVQSSLTQSSIVTSCINLKSTSLFITHLQFWFFCFFCCCFSPIAGTLKCLAEQMWFRPTHRAKPLLLWSSPKLQTHFLLWTHFAVQNGTFVMHWTWFSAEHTATWHKIICFPFHSTTTQNDTTCGTWPSTSGVNLLFLLWWKYL